MAIFKFLVAKQFLKTQVSPIIHGSQILSSILYKLHTWQNHIDGLLSFANDYTRPSRLYAVSIVSDYIAGSSVQDTAVVSEYSSRVIYKLLL